MSRHLAVVGRPIGHSRSPQLFRAALAALGRRGSYARLAARSVEHALQLRAALELDGLNVTAPFKEDMARAVDRLDDAARAIGAVNTVVADADGLLGLNTDPAGVLGALRARHFEPARCRAVIFGAGGAARAAAWALKQAGAERVVLINRSAERAAQAATELGCEHAPLSRAASEVRRAELLVSCVPPGIELIEPRWLWHQPLVLEASYPTSPWTTNARAAGCAVVEGRDWLIHQAIAAFEPLVGCPPPAGAMQAALRPEPAAQKDHEPHVALVGFMGAGKSSLGARLAERLELDLVDTDELCSQQAGKSIAALFDEDGEQAFRSLERAAVERAVQGRRSVLALGGGALLDPATASSVRRHCWVVWLWAPLETCLERIARHSPSRPLLRCADPTDRARALLADRQPTYRDLADLVCSVHDRELAELADEIANEVRRAEHH